MINNPRFEEHYQYQLSSEISERIDLNKELGDMEEDYEQMFSYYEMEQAVSKYNGILGEVLSVEHETMYVKQVRKINLCGNVLYQYSGIVFDSSYREDVWLSNTVIHADEAISFLEDRIDWITKETLVPVVYNNSGYFDYTLMSLENYLIQTLSNYIESEPVFLIDLDVLKNGLIDSFPSPIKSYDRFLQEKDTIALVLDTANGNNYEQEYCFNYDSYCVVASQFDSCDFYSAVQVSCSTTYSNQGEIVYLDDDLPF